MRHIIMSGIVTIAAITVLATNIRADDRPRGGDAKPPTTNKIPRPIPLPIPGPPPSGQVPPNGKVPPTPGRFGGPSVDLTVDVQGDGAVRWGPEICGTAEGQASRICQSKAKKDNLISFNADPRPGNIFIGWGGDCAKHGSQGFCSIPANQALSVSATFRTAPPPPINVPKGKVTIKVEIPYAGGSVQTAAFSDNIINCDHPLKTIGANPTPIAKGKVSGTCSMSVPKGSQVNLSAIKEKFGIFKYWEGTHPGCSKTSGTNCVFEANQDTTVKAIFNTGDVTITAVKNTLPKYRFHLNSSPSYPWQCAGTATQIVGEGNVATQICTAKVRYGSIFYADGKLQYPSGKMRSINANEWTGCNGFEPSTPTVSRGCKILANDNKTVTLNFKRP